MLKTNKVFAALNAAESATRYSRDEVVSKESVLLHTGWIVSFCLLAAKDLEQRGIGTIDYSKLLQSAVVHDFDEIGTGDIPRITKYADETALAKFREIEDRSVRRLEDYLDIKGIYHYWKTSKDSSIEGKLVRVADIASVVYKTMTEIIHKNNYTFYRVSLELADELNIAQLNLTEHKFNSEFTNWIDNLFIDMKAIVKKANTICYDRNIDNLNFSIGE